MSPVAVVSGKEAIKRFLRLGYEITRQRGSHVRLWHPDALKHRPLTIPLHKELKPGLLHQILKDAGIDLKTFLDL